MFATRATALLRRPASSLRNPAQACAAIRSATAWGFSQEISASQQRLKCSKNASIDSGTSVAATPSSLITPNFWASRALWKRAAINTLRCLAGCTVGDFSAMWYLQASYPSMGTGTTMAISMVAGITTSMLLETALLRLGRDRLPWVAAARTAAGMSMISMITMELAENVVDYHLTGGAIQLDSPAFWGAAILAISAGFIAPLPYNYARLRKYGKACH